MDYQYTEAIKLIRDYFSGNLEEKVTYFNSKHNEKALAYLAYYKNAVKSFLTMLKDSDPLTNTIIAMYDRDCYIWQELANELMISESGAQRRRNKAIKELNEWINF